MSNGTQWNDLDKGKIVAIRGLGQICCKISKQDGRSKAVCKSYYENQNILEKITMVTVCQLGSNMTSAAKIKENVKLKVSRWTVRRVLNKNPNLIYTHLQRKSILSKQHKERRLTWWHWIN